jgi:hypothetical protein
LACISLSLPLPSSFSSFFLPLSFFLFISHTLENTKIYESF